MKNLIFLLVFISSFSTFSQVQVALIKIYRPDCSVLYLEPNFAYAHIAISYEGGWINAHPKHGVQLTKTLEELDFPKHESFIWEAPKSLNLKPLSAVQAEKYRGLEYDRSFNWCSNDALYCSELVAKIMQLPPQPMVFDPKIWPKEYWKLNGRPGISPFLLFKEMLELGFLPASSSSF